MQQPRHASVGAVALCGLKLYKSISKTVLRSRKMNVEVLGQAFGTHNPHHIIGSLFRFRLDGFENTELVGTIRGYQLTNVSELMVTVSNRYYETFELVGLRFSADGKWYIAADWHLSELKNEFPGTLKILK